MKQSCTAVLSFLLLGLAASGQEAASSFSLPFTISGAARYSHDSSGEDGIAGGFRALLTPSLQLGSHWFAYSVLDAQSSSYYDYSTGLETNRNVRFTLMQGYAGYKTEFKSVSLLVKAGRLASAFGYYPLEYDDSKSPFIDPPALYTRNTVLRPDQLACNLNDVITQFYDEGIHFHCGGSAAERYGLVPVTIYGVPALETQLSWNRFDARLQLTNSSPANVQSLLSRSQSAQLTVGAGYSFHGGLRVGMSAFRGPYLERMLEPLLPKGTNISDFPATGIGIDAQWSGGPLSLEGEWQRFRFALPGFAESPSTQGAYVQAKLILSPRIFTAARINLQFPGGATDVLGHAAKQIDWHAEIEELTAGYRLNRFQLLKTSVVFDNSQEWIVSGKTWPRERTMRVEFQLVTSLNILSKGFH